MSEEDEIIKKRIAQIFPSPQVATTIVDIAVHNRPQGWSRKSNAPYYQEKYAIQIKADIDRMIETGLELFYKYSIWCGEEEEKMSKQTLYNRINQSIRFVVECMDGVDRKYGKWYQSVRIERHRGPGGGISIAYIPGLHEKESFSAELVEPRADLPHWRLRLNTWLENDDPKPFIVEKLMLDMEEVIRLKTELAGLESIKAVVTPTTIKAIKVGH